MVEADHEVVRGAGGDVRGVVVVADDVARGGREAGRLEGVGEVAPVEVVAEGGGFFEGGGDGVGIPAGVAEDENGVRLEVGLEVGSVAAGELFDGRLVVCEEVAVDGAVGVDEMEGVGGVVVVGSLEGVRGVGDEVGDVEELEGALEERVEVRGEDGAYEAGAFGEEGGEVEVCGVEAVIDAFDERGEVSADPVGGVEAPDAVWGECVAVGVAAGFGSREAGLLVEGEGGFGRGCERVFPEGAGVVGGGVLLVFLRVFVGEVGSCEVWFVAVVAAEPPGEVVVDDLARRWDERCAEARAEHEGNGWAVWVVLWELVGVGASVGVGARREEVLEGGDEVVGVHGGHERMIRPVRRSCE